MSEKLSNKQSPNTHFGVPGAIAVTRNQVGGDWAAALLLYRLKWRWQMKKKLVRLNREWVAMSRSDWAREAGLSEGEMKNRALPILRKCNFVVIRAMMLKETKLLWMSLDLSELESSTLDFETHNHLLNGGKPPGYEKPKGNYPYKKQDDWLAK